MIKPKSYNMDIVEVFLNAPYQTNEQKKEAIEIRWRQSGEFPRKTKKKIRKCLQLALKRVCYAEANSAIEGIVNNTPKK